MAQTKYDLRTNLHLLDAYNSQKEYKMCVFYPQMLNRLKSHMAFLSISERPIEATGKRFGDFEMDTIVGKDGHGAIVTLTERSTNMLFMRKLTRGKNAKNLVRTVIHLLAPFKGRVKSITTDNGTEFASHKMITKSIGAQVYFTGLYCSWQKGAIENANKLIRQYIPKGTDFNDISNMFIKKIQHKINARPRRKLNFNTPLQEFYKHFY